MGLILDKNAARSVGARGERRPHEGRRTDERPCMGAARLRRVLVVVDVSEPPARGGAAPVDPAPVDPVPVDPATPATHGSVRGWTSRAAGWGLPAIAGLVALAVFARPWLQQILDQPAIANWATVFVAVVVAAAPFLVLGVAVSGAVTAFVPTRLVTRLVPGHPALAVPAAAVAGAALPGCECGSVPVARRLMSRGIAPSAALAFMLSSPAINPVVLVSTAVAFPGRPEMVLARALAGAAAAVAIGWVWAALKRDDLLTRARRPTPDAGSPLATFLATAQHDFLSAGGFLVVGAAAAATLQTVVPRSVVESFAGSGWWSVLALALLAVILAICSEADAFVAASLWQFSPTAQLAFLVVGPMVDVKLAAMQAGAFGRAFALRFVPVTFACALGSATLCGWWLL